MKKRLLKPPTADGEILFRPDPREFLDSLQPDSRIGVAHQPYFFSPGVSLKFLFLDQLPVGNKQVVFVDTDSVKLLANVPGHDGSMRTVVLAHSDRVLLDYPTPSRETLDEFFLSIEEELVRILPDDRESVRTTFSRFKEITRKHCQEKYLKQMQVGSFLEFYGLNPNYCFLSELLDSQDYARLCTQIYEESDRFRQLYNDALDQYRREFKFRYRNYPFPHLEEGELPFWLLQEGKRTRCFKQDVEPNDFSKGVLLPRAATLTIFLRLCQVHFFVHGIGGGNYEWVQDQIIEQFFHITPPPYAIMTGTFLIQGVAERELPYFLFPPRRIRESARAFIEEHKPSRLGQQ